MSASRNSNLIPQIGLAIVFSFGTSYAVWSLFIEDDSSPETEEAYSSKHVDEDGPYTDEFLEYTRLVELDTYGGNWELAIVVEDFGSADGVKVKTAKGFAVLYSECYEAPDTYVSSVVNDGEMIVYSKRSEDYNICDGEVFTVRTKHETEELVEKVNG